MLISKVMKDILTIINYHYGKEFRQDSIYFPDSSLTFATLLNDR